MKQCYKKKSLHLGNEKYGIDKKRIKQRERYFKVLEIFYADFRITAVGNNTVKIIGIKI